MPQFSTGVYSTGAPNGLPTDDWSGRLTGEITFGTTGTYELRATREGMARVYLDWKLIIDDWVDETGSTDPYSIAVTAGDRKSITVEYANPDSDASLILEWKPPAGSWEAIGGENLSPGYNLVSTQVDPDGLEVGTGYDSLETGVPVDSIVDPDGFALVMSVEYETEGAGKYNRRLSRTLPGGNEWIYAYYTDAAGNDATRDNPCTVANDPAWQGAGLKTRTGPTPKSGTAIIEEFVYDEFGRSAATRIGTESWTCMSYDSRGRVGEVKAPSFGGHAARTITYDYAVSSNPLVSSVTDAEGTMTTEIDLLGRPVATTDIWNKTLETTYDQPGRGIETDGPAGVQTWTYDAAGRVITQSLGGELIADVDYDAYGRLLRVDYPSGTGKAGNGTSLDVVGYDTLGRLDELVWKDSSGGTLTSDAVTRSLAGRVIDQSIDGTDPYTTGHNYVYDAAGRLTTARIANYTFTYAFAASSCTGNTDANHAAGKNTNRTSWTVGDGTNPPTTYDSCYDHADRLIDTDIGNVGSAITYDAHGNTTDLGTEQDFTYDATNRSLAQENTTTGKDVEYTRDATDNIVERIEDSTVIARYTMGAALSGSNTVIETYISLPGGVQVTISGTNETWSYPNVHGDIVAIANAGGAKQGSTMQYEPYGISLGSLPDNGVGDFDRGWIGVRDTEHANSLIPIIQMGHRPYSPYLGRFLEPDPIESGSASAYEYAFGDPVGNSDTDGLTCIPKFRPLVEYLRIIKVAWTNIDWGHNACGWNVHKYYSATIHTLENGTRWRAKGGGKCSFGGNTGPTWNFTKACQIHDYGYDLIRFFSQQGASAAYIKSARITADVIFHLALIVHCDSRAFTIRWSCRDAQALYYGGVRINSWWENYRTPKGQISAVET